MEPKKVEKLSNSMDVPDEEIPDTEEEKQPKQKVVLESKGKRPRIVISAE